MKAFFSFIAMIVADFLKWVALTFITLYQIILSPFLPISCRFQPTCSSYARQALKKHGFFYGGWLTMLRVGKCHPWHKGGHDPVRERKAATPR